LPDLQSLGQRHRGLCDLVRSLLLCAYNIGTALASSLGREN
jgi:hypothetical protein